MFVCDMYIYYTGQHLRCLFSVVVNYGMTAIQGVRNVFALITVKSQ